MKTLLSISLILFSFVVYSQDLRNKFTNPSNKDTSIAPNFLPSILINANSQFSKQLNAAKNLNSPIFLDSKSLIDTTIKVIYSNETSLPIFIEKQTVNQIKKSQSTDTTIRIKSISEVNRLSYKFIDEIESITHISDPKQNLEIIETNIEQNGKSHIKFQQKYRGIKIYGNEFLIHLNAKGEGELFNGKFSIISDTLDVIPTLDIDKAINIVKLDLYKKNKLVDLKAFELNLIGGSVSIIDTFVYNNKLAYKITYYPNIIDRYEYFVDANSGAILFSYNTTCTIDVSKVVTSLDLNGISQKINVTYTGSNYILKDISKPMYNIATGDGFLQILDNNNTYGNNRVIDEIVNTTNIWSPLQTSAQYNLSSTYDYFLNVHNRNSIDGKGGNIFAIINMIMDSTGKPYLNASWSDAGFMFFGNGDNSIKPYAGSLDISAHEMTHGVIANSTSKLIYNGQSGALNESFSDIFGVMVDSSNWTIGETIVNKVSYPSGAIRSLKDPNNGALNSNDRNWQPKHMNEFVSGAVLDNYIDRDNEGVHINSGIPNYAFYLYANAIGKLKASKVYYRALTTYLLPNSNFTDLRLSIIKAASDLYSSNEVLQASYVFDAVGISDGVTPSVIKQLPINAGVENMMLYSTGDTTIYLATPNLKALWSKKVNNKASFTDDGKTAYFVGNDKKIYSVTTDPSIIQPTFSLIQSTPMWSNVAISKDGKRLAAATSYQDSSIYVYDFTKAKWYRYKLYNPTYNNGVKADGPLYADSFEWDYSSENIIYDCFNKIAGTNLNSEIKFWDINIINVWNKAKDTTGNGVISKLFNLSSGDNVGNPTFSKNSPDVIAFDYFNDSTKTYGIIGYNILTNSVGTILLNNTIGYPTYNKNDNKLAFNSILNNKLTISTINLNNDKISSNGIMTPLFNNATFPVYYTVGIRKFIVPSTPLISFTGKTNLCSGDSIILKSSATSGNQWYRNGSPITSATDNTFVIKNAGNYMVLSNIDGISSSLSSGLYITTNTTPQTPSVTNATYCINTTASTLSATAIAGASLNWYGSNETGGIANNSAPTPSTTAAGIFNYYVSQLSSGCESPRSKISITINPSPASPIVTNLSYCIGTTASTLSATAIAGNTLNWYGTSATGGTASKTAPTPSTTTAGTFNYYVSQLSTSTGCESPRSNLGVTINSLPAAPIVSNLSYCIGAASSSLSATAIVGATLNWYGTSATGGIASKTAPTPSTTTAGTFNYYVSHLSTSTGCESSRSNLVISVLNTPTAPVLSRDVNNFLVSNVNGITWYKDGAQMPDTTQKLKPSVAGLYTAKTTQNGCSSALSTPYYYLVTDIINLSADEFIQLAPNPFINKLNFNFVIKGYQKLNIDVFDIATGIRKGSMQNLTPGMPISLGQLSAGTYYIRVSSNDGKINHQFKMVKL
jgi:Zn-dependent metalloprotease